MVYEGGTCSKRITLSANQQNVLVNVFGHRQALLDHLKGRSHNELMEAKKERKSKIPPEISYCEDVKEKEIIDF